MAENRVEQFVRKVRSRLNQNLFWTLLVWAGAIGAVATVIAGLVYVAQGYAVPRPLYPIAISLAVLSAVGVWWSRQISQAEASVFVDEHFGLKDTVTACRNFADEGKAGGYFDLQAKQANQRVDEVSTYKIPFAFPRRTLAVGLAFGAAAALMAFIGPSQAVKDRMALEIATLDQTKQANDHLEELVKELEEEIKDEEERKLVEPNKLREWVKELRETKDQKEALRQYAKLELKLQKASAKLQQKRDEQYLERAAKELDKAEETKKLAKKLEQKKYKEAASDLEKMKPEERKPLSEQRKQVAKLKSAAKRMAAAAKQQSGKQRSGKQVKKSSPSQLAKSQASKNSANPKASQNSSGAENQGKSGQMASASQSQTGEMESVEELVEQLDQALEELEQQLSEAEMQELEQGQCDAEKMAQCSECQGKAQKALGKLSKKLGRMSMKRKLQSKLSALCKACSNCQTQCAGLGPSQAQALVRSANPGGKKAGWGSSDTRRNERDELQDNGQYTQLKGIKGDGPSVASLEEAEDGSGVSTARGVAASRSFQRQMEAFVEREDVPDDVKSGVRNYFEMIHQSE